MILQIIALVLLAIIAVQCGAILLFHYLSFMMPLLTEEERQMLRRKLSISLRK